MNDYVLSTILGVVEGLTEFLPVSSSAHLRIAESLLHISLTNGYWLMYTVVIQLGAILCLPVYFRREIARFLATFPRGARGNRTVLTHPLTLVCEAFVVTAVPAYLLAKVIGKNLESLTIMGVSLIVGGAIMWIVDRVNAPAEAAGPGAPGRVHTWAMADMSFGQAVWVGFWQIASAVFPGTSRSMATIASGQVVGLSRAAALEFSFFLSMPTMGAATLYALYEGLRGKGDSPFSVAQIDAHGAVVLLIGFVVSFFVAYASVAWFMAWVRKHGFVPFAIYRIILGALVLGMLGS